MIRYIVRFQGHVQGVCFRANALLQAKGLDVRGFVRNEADGSVLLDVVGPERDLQMLVKRIRTTMQANITEVQRESRTAEDRPSGFRIR
ncbi:acylphosphatase [Novipirellula artificiosorum]|uniref:acylphosphatase n=1 Tax=Novipirellula artificiosorum TaxID=2528016 RepID=A0A5C6D9K2_9BACT|nr:acylphosphatase [Novipirellula artificiosorum]TWU33803.1 Acylphosphatase [Novipirellula artificiosorum]